MGYGKFRPDVSKKSVSEQQAEKLEGKEFKGEIGRPKEVNPDSISDDDKWLQEANAAANNARFIENPDLAPPEFFEVDKDAPTKRQQKMKEGYTLISQSLVKKLISKSQEEEEFCPKYIKHCVMDRKGMDITSDPILAGKFFESKVLGSTTGGSPVLDLRRKRLSKAKAAELKSKNLPLLGEKRIDQIRLETQADRFLMKVEERQAQIIHGVNTHIDIFKRWDDKYLLVGEFDWFPTPFFYEEKLRLAIVDVKVTSNVKTTFGAFCWGTPQYMDHIQADLYHYLVQDIDFELNPHLKEVITPSVQHVIDNKNIVFLYWVWGYQGEPLEHQEKIVERTLLDEGGTNYRQMELMERIRKAIAVIEREESFGWEAKPVQDHCKYCSLNKEFGGDCGLSINTKV